MTSFIVAYLWCIYSLLFLNSNGQAITNNLCLWGCSDAEKCMNMNGVFYAIETSTQKVNNKQYYKQDDRDFTNCEDQVYYIYWRADLGSLGWYIGFGDGTVFEFGDTNINGRCLDRSQGSGYNSAYPGTCDYWEFLDGINGWTAFPDVTVTEGDCPQVACGALNIDVDTTTPTPTPTPTILNNACETDVIASTLPQVGPYPNTFYGDKGASLGNPTLFYFNHKAWRWGCWRTTDAGVEEPRCGGLAAGVTAYSPLTETFTALTAGESTAISMDVFDGSTFSYTTDVTIECVGSPSVSITLSPTDAGFGLTPVAQVTYEPTSPTTESPTAVGDTRSPTAPTAPTVATTQFPTPPTIDCSIHDCSGNSGSGGNNNDTCSGFGGLCWYWWLLIFLLILCVLCICCILLFKCCKKRQENKSKETEMFGAQGDDTGNQGGSYQPEPDYGNKPTDTNQQQYNQNQGGNNQWGNNNQNQYNQNQGGSNQYGGNQGGNQYGGNQGGNQWGNNQGGNQYGNQGGNQWGNQGGNQYGNNQGGNQNWGGNQTYTQD